eukprot:IDg5021t1
MPAVVIPRRQGFTSSTGYGPTHHCATRKLNTAGAKTGTTSGTQGAQTKYKYPHKQPVDNVQLLVSEEQNLEVVASLTATSALIGIPNLDKNNYPAIETHLQADNSPEEHDERNKPRYDYENRWKNMYNDTRR